MDKFINPKIYKHEKVEIDGVMRTGLYFQDINERDWYETLTNWKGGLCLDSGGVVIAYEKDTSYLGMEEGRDVYEVDPAKVPDDVLGNFTYSDGVFTDIRPTAEQVFELKKKELLSNASDTISILQFAVDSNKATEEESILLFEMQTYRLSLNRLEFGEDWPKLPVSK